MDIDQYKVLTSKAIKKGTREQNHLRQLKKYLEAEETLFKN